MSDASQESDPGLATQHVTRAEYLRADGFVMYTAMNVRFLDEVRVETLRPADHTAHIQVTSECLRNPNKGLNRSNLGLHLATHSIVNGSTIIPGGNYGEPTLQQMFGLSEQDLAGTKNKGIYNYGIDDRGFPWNFSAGVAAATVHAFVRDGLLEGEHAGSLGLRDWAEILRSTWFSRVMHSLAFTHNGIYQHFGAHPGDFGNNSLDTQLNERLRYAFKVTDESIERTLETFVEVDPEHDTHSLGAKIDPAARTILRLAMSSNNILGGELRGSTGCPVARKVTRMPRAEAMANPHVIELIERGIFSVMPDSSADNVQIEQAVTGIDRTLRVHADKLDEYDRRFGMPSIVAYAHSNSPLQHVEMPETGILTNRVAG